MATRVSPQAVIDPRAELDHGVVVGPWCVIGPDARIAQGTELINSVTILGECEIGRDCRIFPGCVLGAEPQDAHYRGGATRLVIGDRNTIRENVTINGGAAATGGTRIGSDGFLMSGVHVAHDCYLGDFAVLAGGALLGGHVWIAHHAVLSGAVCVHPWCTIGEHSFIEGNTRVLQDVPPFTLFDGQPARPRCINGVGLARCRFSESQIAALVEAHRLVFRAKQPLAEVRQQLEDNDQMTAEVERLLEFLAQQHRGRHGRSREKARQAA